VAFGFGFDAHGGGVHTGHPVPAPRPAELLQLLHDWLGTDPGRLNQSLIDFAGSSAYNLVDLHTDLSQFTFLLGTGHGEGLFNANAEWRSDGPTPDSSELG
jgi:hypothetical protein